MSDRPPPIHSEIDETLPPGLRPTSYCPPLPLLRAYQEHVLPSTLASEIAEHLQHCGLCPILLADLEHVPQPALTAEERQLIRQTIPSPLRAPGWRWYAGFATAAVFILAIVFLVLRHAAPTPNQTGQTEQTKPSPLPQQTHLEIAKLDPPLELARDLVLRGTVPPDQPNPAELAPAFESYTQSDYPLAAQRFSLLTKQFPRADIPFLYLGVTQLLQNDSTAALPNLARADHLAPDSRKDSAAWYHALAASQTHAPEAPSILHSMCLRKDSAYSPQACQLEKKWPDPPR
jgi:hypothetical protein